MKVTLKSITPNAEVNIVEIARVSSSRTDKSEKPEGLINYLIKNSHFSPFEHSYMTVEIVTTKSIGIQLLRYRSFTFQEFSQRYSKVEEIEDFELRVQAATNRQSSSNLFEDNIEAIKYVDEWTQREYSGFAKDLIGSYMKTTMNLYSALLDAGVAKECARMVLPMATQTTIYMTGSVRSWLHFLNIRLDSHAQKEAVEIATKIGKIFAQEMPIITKATGDFNNYQGMFM